ncbi:MAG: SDR family oxidoreductase [Planctomycetota bacterium]|nr:SDR family oxidoreductase [Planctomycetota bacterium]
MTRITSYRDLGCLVTGASSGIGREIARQLAQAGARIVVTARREDRLAALEVELKELGAKDAFAVVADLSDPGAAEQIVRAADAHLGHVDVLINNAGFAVPGTFMRADLERTARMIEVNITSSVRLARLVLPGMVTRNHGAILNVASIAGFQAAPYQGTYAGTKAFLLVWSDSVHQEVKHTDVSITALCPGVTDTEFFEAAGYRRLGRILKHRMPVDAVAKAGLRGLVKRKMEVVPGFKNRVLLFSQRFVPRTLVAAVSRRMLAGRPEPQRP